MALVVPTLGEMSGKLGGLVFFRNKGGLCVRAFAVPTNPNSARQQATRNWVAWCASSWESVLTEVQRAQWREWAQTHTWLNALGQTINLTGLNWYTMVNTRLLDVAATPLATPGDISAPDPLLTMALTLTDAVTISLAFTPVLESGYRIVAWGSGPISAGANPNFRQCRLIGYSAADVATPAALTLPYTLQDGCKLKVYAGIMSDRGRYSVLLVDDAIYTAP